MSHDHPSNGRISVTDAATRLYVCGRTVRSWVRQGFIDAIPANPHSRKSKLLVCVACIERIEAARVEQSEFKEL